MRGIAIVIALVVALGWVACARPLRPDVEPPPPPSSIDAPAAPPDAIPPDAAPSPDPAPAPTVTLAAVGDITLGGRYEPWLDREVRAGRLDAASALRYGLAQVRDVLAAADLALGNLEGTFAQRSPRGAGDFAFKARPELARTLVDGGLDVVALGNNHTMDYGSGGVLETLAALDAAQLGWSGAGRDAAEAHRAWLAEVRGVRLGFLSYKVTGRHDVDQPATGVVFHADGPTVAWCHFDWPCIRDLVATDVAALAARVDVVVVSLHWGEERSYVPAAYQVALGHAAIDAGALVVVGSHPHVVQGVERYGRGVVFYSLGNFLFGGNDAPFDPIGAIARVEVGRAGVVAAELLPVRTTSRAAPFQPTPLEGAERARALEAFAERSRGLLPPAPAPR